MEVSSKMQTKLKTKQMSRKYSHTKTAPPFLYTHTGNSETRAPCHWLFAMLQGNTIECISISVTAQYIPPRLNNIDI